MVTEHYDYPPINNCRHPKLTYGELCIKCGECGRFKMECLNCHKMVRNPVKQKVNNWGVVELLDVIRAPICPECRSKFQEEDMTNFPDAFWKAKTIPCYKKDFVKR